LPSDVMSTAATFAVDAIGEGLLGPERAALAGFLVGLLLTFIGIRANTRLIRAYVSWWFHDIESDDGLHVHHMVIGVVVMVVAGLLLIALLPTGLWLQLTAMLFGGGVALTLDEFALILRLQDVYWTTEGRLSIDAVIVVLCVAVLFLLGFRPLVGEGDTGVGAAAHAVFVIVIVINFAFAVLCFLKGKLWTGLFGMFIPIVGEVGAIRLARPGSPWARWRYTKRPKKLARAQRREDRLAASVRSWKSAFYDLIAGKPHLPSMVLQTPEPGLNEDGSPGGWSGGSAGDSSSASSAGASDGLSGDAGDGSPGDPPGESSDGSSGDAAAGSPGGCSGGSPGDSESDSAAGSSGDRSHDPASESPM